MLDSLSRKQHLLLDAQAAERIVEPWGQAYDAERFREQQIQAERQRVESLKKAEQLRRQADEEIRRANQQAAPLPANQRGGGRIR